MKYLLLLLIPGIIFAQQTAPATVKKVDLKKYTGTWYEIAKIPNSFQSDCKGGTTAKYTLNEDGEIEVLNSCYEEDGNLYTADGTARVVDKNSNAKLEVSFVSLLGWNLFWGDYWIIGLDDNYEWAIVGHPKRKYGWILSRTPQLTDSVREEINSILRQNGYNPKDFQNTDQSRNLK